MRCFAPRGGRDVARLIEAGALGTDTLGYRVDPADLRIVPSDRSERHLSMLHS